MQMSKIISAFLTTLLVMQMGKLLDGKVIAASQMPDYNNVFWILNQSVHRITVYACNTFTHLKFI